MSIDLIKISESSLVTPKTAIQFVPSLAVLEDAFSRLVSCYLCRSDHQEILVEMQQEHRGHSGIHQTYERLIAAPIKFHKFKENGRDIWLYYGPAKER